MTGKSKASQYRPSPSRKGVLEGRGEGAVGGGRGIGRSPPPRHMLFNSSTHCAHQPALPRGRGSSFRSSSQVLGQASTSGCHPCPELHLGSDLTPSHGPPSYSLGHLQDPCAIRSEAPDIIAERAVWKACTPELLVWGAGRNQLEGPTVPSQVGAGRNRPRAISAARTLPFRFGVWRLRALCRPRAGVARPRSLL